MKIEMGESLVYSWLRHVKKCQVVQTNWKVSPKWELKHKAELQTLMELTDRHFSEKYGYQIYKKNASLSQIIQQGECDAVGISVQNGQTKVYAVDVAFHEAGLNYGNRRETVMKIVAKSVRTAMCIYGFFDTKSAEIVFASPKIYPAVLNDVHPCIADANDLLNQQGFDFNIRVVANNEFNEFMLQPILRISDGVADTSELLMRSYQLFKMFENGSEQKNSKNTEAKTTATDEKKPGVGAIANTVLRRMLEAGAASRDEIESYLTKEGSQSAFSLNFPLLVHVEGNFENTRYYVEPLLIFGERYRMTSQWYEKQREPLQTWIAIHSEKAT